MRASHGREHHLISFWCHAALDGQLSMAALDFLKRAWRAEHSRLKLLLWASLIGLIFGALELGEPLEETLRISRNHLLTHEASGDIVIVGIDDRSLAKLGSWPWPRRYHAELIEKLEGAGARHIAFDIKFSSPSNPEDDLRLAGALARAKRPVTLAVAAPQDAVSGRRRAIVPLPAFTKHASLASIDFYYNRKNAVWKLPFAWDVAGTSHPSMAASLSHSRGGVDEWFHIDYSIDLRSIPVVSAVDILEGRISSEVAGKTVVIGAVSRSIEDLYFAPGYGRTSGVYVHVAAAETIKARRPVELGWMLPLLAVVFIAAICLTLRRTRSAIVALSTGTVGLLIIPLPLQPMSIIFGIVPALMVMLVATGRLSWIALRQSFRERGLVNSVSGLPNLDALRDQKVDTARPLIAARIQNFAEVAAALPAEQEKALSSQIVNRLTLGRSDLTLYHGDDGVFAWCGDPVGAALLREHLDALHMMFRSPVVVAGNSFDLAVTFGVDASSERSPANRLASALVAADDAAAQGRRWSEYDPGRLKDAGWRLSLLSQLDTAIDAGDFWVAYQPKLDLASGRIVGAEALARWTHPEKGPISPLEFIAAAEQNDRIEKLTYHVLDRGVAAAAAINALGFDFGIAVNLSARLIDEPAIVEAVSRLLATHRLAAKHLTLEVTETAAANSSDRSFETLDKLRGLGVQLSIDDYGTGLSTLNYLKRIPATEIKIDRSFVQAMMRSHDDKVLVTSTIELAHSLGHRVVAEGVEDDETLDALKRAGCDAAQGYLIGKPLPLQDFQKEFFKSRRSWAA